MCARKRGKGDAWLPQQLCHHVGGNYESAENGGGGTGAKALTTEREGNVSIRPRTATTPPPNKSRLRGTESNLSKTRGLGVTGGDVRAFECGVAGVRREGQRGAPGVETGLIITCTAACYFCTGGWAAACLQQRLPEPLH